MNVWRGVYRYGLLLVLLVMASACAPQSNDDLAIELRWSGNADLDLMVTVPNGQRITYANPMAGAPPVIVRAAILWPRGTRAAAITPSARLAPISMVSSATSRLSLA
jgi:hypothetical protein